MNINAVRSTGLIFEYNLFQNAGGGKKMSSVRQQCYFLDVRFRAGLGLQRYFKPCREKLLSFTLIPEGGALI